MVVDMSPDKQNAQNNPVTPWYRQFWPWFIIALPATAVVASFVTLWLAISRPDYIVIDEDDYQRLKSGLKGQEVEQKTDTDHGDVSGTEPE